MAIATHKQLLNTRATIAHARMLRRRSCFSPTSVRWVRNSLAGRSASIHTFMVLKYMFVIFSLLISFNVNAEELTSELKDEEGYKQCAYNDSNGNPTIGYGECIAIKCGGKNKINKEKLVIV